MRPRLRDFGRPAALILPLLGVFLGGDRGGTVGAFVVAAAAAVPRPQKLHAVRHHLDPGLREAVLADPARLPQAADDHHRAPLLQKLGAELRQTLTSTKLTALRFSALSDFTCRFTASDIRRNGMPPGFVYLSSGSRVSRPTTIARL